MGESTRAVPRLRIQGRGLHSWAFSFLADVTSVEKRTRVHILRVAALCVPNAPWLCLEHGKGLL